MLWFPVGYEVFIRGLEEMDKITIAIAEDQEYTRETLARIVESQEDFALVGTAQMEKKHFIYYVNTIHRFYFWIC